MLFKPADRYQMMQTYKRNAECISRNEMIQKDDKKQIDDNLSNFTLRIIPCDTYSNSSYDAHISTYGILNDSVREAIPKYRWANCRSGKALDFKLKLLDLISQCSEEVTVSDGADTNTTNSTLLEQSDKEDQVYTSSIHPTCFAINIMAKSFDEYFSALEPTSPDEVNNELRLIQERAQAIHTKMTDFESPLIFKTLDRTKQDVHVIFDKLKLKLPQ